MAVYATSADLTAYLQNDGLSVPDGAVEALLDQAQEDVDRAVGAFPKLASGLVFDPTLLAAAQQDALRRATCAAAEYRLATEDEAIGASEFLSGPVTLAWRGPRPPGPKVLEALAGHGLFRRSGCAQPTPEPPRDADPR